MLTLVKIDRRIAEAAGAVRNSFGESIQDKDEVYAANGRRLFVATRCLPMLATQVMFFGDTSPDWDDFSREMFMLVVRHLEINTGCRVISTRTTSANEAWLIEAGFKVFRRGSARHAVRRVSKESMEERGKWKH